MKSMRRTALGFGLALLGAAGLVGCRNHMPHSFTWPGGGEVIPSHPKPPEGGYYSNWDPYAVELEVTPLEDTNPVRTQHVLVATVKDKNGKPLPNRRVEWMINEGSVGDIVEVDESGWRAGRGYKWGNDYAISHTNNFKHVLDRGNDDPSDDVHLTVGQTWCVITSPVEGDTHITVYAPGIYDWSKHKVFAVKHWYDVDVICPPQDAAPAQPGQAQSITTKVVKHSDKTGLANYDVIYKLADGCACTFEGGGKMQTVKTNPAGEATINIAYSGQGDGCCDYMLEVWRPENTQCCKPAVKLGECTGRRCWVTADLTIDKSCAPGKVMTGDTLTWTITVRNPSRADATNVMVTDSLPNCATLISATPPPSAGGSWALGTIAAGSSATITVQTKAGGQKGMCENCAEVRADNVPKPSKPRACCACEITMGALAITKECPKAVTVCDTWEYVITVRNPGDGPARNVRITDNLPAGVTTTDGRSSVEVNVGELPPGGQQQTRVMVKAAKPGTYTNTAKATADGGLTADSAPCTTEVTQPVLQVTKKGPTQVYIGRNATYQITVSNSGNTVARQTMLTDTLPPNTTFVSASDGGSASGSMASWNLGDIAPGQSKTVQIVLKINAAGDVKNVATAKAVCAEASGDYGFPAKGIPAVLLEVVDIADPIEVGAQETYDIIVTNQGSANDTNIVIRVDIPAEMQFVSAAGPVQGTASGQVVTFAPLPSLAPQAKAIYKVVTKGIKAADVRFKVTLTTDQTGSVPVEETESTHVYE